MNDLFDPERYPTMPGCFLIKDAQGRALLVGGTVNLRQRLAALLEESRQQPPRARVRNRLDDRVQRVVALASEIEVFLLPGSARDLPALANGLIERFHPLFNLATYMEPSGSAYITQTDEPYPRLVAGRQAESIDCFGPFPSAARDLLLKVITESFGLRTCQPMPRRACISYQLKLCCAPCEGRVSREEYDDRVSQAARCLSAPGPDLIETLEAQMELAAGEQEFARARRIRGQIHALRPVILQLAEIRGAGWQADHDQDAVYLGQGKAFVTRVQRGALREMLFHDAPGSDDEAAALAYLRLRYAHAAPPEIVLNIQLPDPDGLAAHLSASNGYPVTLTLPSGGQAADLLEIARINHEYRLGLPGIIP